MTMQDTRIRPTFGYYRQPNGWITVSPATELEELSYRKEKWEPLTRYGRVEMTSEYMAEHPLEPLFIAGGAKELPIEQVIEMGFAMNPPLLPTCSLRIDQFHKHHTQNCWLGAEPVSFPQLKGLAYSSYPCTIASCSRVLPTEKARDKHEGVAHKPEKSDIRTGQTLADSLAKALAPAASVDNTDIFSELAVLRAEIAALKGAKPKLQRKRQVGIAAQ